LLIIVLCFIETYVTYNFKIPLLVSLCLSVRPNVNPREQLKAFSRNLALRGLLQLVDILQFWPKSDSNNGHFIEHPKHLCAHFEC
jgi:hypothetical protein